MSGYIDETLTAEEVYELIQQDRDEGRSVPW